MEEFVSFEIAKKLKEKGFRENCLAYYNNDYIEYNYESPLFNNEMWFSHNSYDNLWHRDYIDAPMIPQVLEWLRKKKIVVSILPTGYNKETGLPGYYYVIYDVTEYMWKKYEYPQSFETWEECAIESIEYVLDNLI